MGERLGPGAAAVVRHGSHQSSGTAVGPAVLLKDADDVVRIRGIDLNPRLDLGVDVVRLPGTGLSTAGKRARRLGSNCERSCSVWVRICRCGSDPKDDERADEYHGCATLSTSHLLSSPPSVRGL